MVRLRNILLFFVAAVLALLLWCYGTAVAPPVVREASIALDDWPKGEPPLRAVLLSDIHVAGPDMPPARVERIVEQVNELQPDLIFITGDLVSDKKYATRYYSVAEAVAPLAGLRAKLGILAVLGNHDHWRNAQATREALGEASITVLDNSANKVGPLVIGGLDDDFTGRADISATQTAMAQLDGPRIVIGHSPDSFPELDGSVQLMLAGHTHCGQIAPPLIGPLSTMSAYGERYACGLVRENGQTLIVSAGLGTSILPLRLGAVPDIWLLRLGPAG